jgi:hypothetical protein
MTIISKPSNRRPTHSLPPPAEANFLKIRSEFTLYNSCLSLRWSIRCIKTLSHPVGWLWFALVSGNARLPNGLGFPPNNKGEDQVGQDNNLRRVIDHYQNTCFY